MIYYQADGHDNEAGYTKISVQPYCTGVMYARRIIALSAVYDDGEAFAKLVYSVLKPSQYSALLTEFGLASALENDITITLPNAARTTTNWNGTIVKPFNPQFRVGLYHEVEFMLIQLEAT